MFTACCACYPQGMERLAELTSLEPAVVLNAAFCERHRANCGTSTQLQRECGRVRGLPYQFTGFSRNGAARVRPGAGAGQGEEGWIERFKRKETTKSGL